MMGIISLTTLGCLHSCVYKRLFWTKFFDARNERYVYTIHVHYSVGMIDMCIYSCICYLSVICTLSTYTIRVHCSLVMNDIHTHPAFIAIPLIFIYHLHVKNKMNSSMGTSHLTLKRTRTCGVNQKQEISQKLH